MVPGKIFIRPQSKFLEVEAISNFGIWISFGLLVFELWHLAFSL